MDPLGGPAQHGASAVGIRVAKDLTAALRFANHQLDIKSPKAFETFTVTAWGSIPTFEQLMSDFPAVDRQVSNLDRLRERLARWGAG